MKSNSTSSETLSTRLGHSLSLDLRSLALFRVVLGGLLLTDLLQRSMDLRAFYTDAGVLPRGVVVQNFYVGQPSFSLHLCSGSPWIQSALFLLAGCFALMLLLGIQTRWSTIISWILLVSLQNRNTLILDAGDDVLRLVLFWSMFLPLGACFSVDRALHPPEKPATSPLVLSHATAAFILQLSFIYFFSALFKTNALWTIDRTATYYALRLEAFSTPLGRWLLHFPNLLKYSTVFVLRFELLAPLLMLLSSSRTLVRAWVVAAFMVFHLVLGACLALGIFTAICILMWTALLPSGFWDWTARLRPFRIRHQVQCFYDSECAFCVRMILLIRGFLALPEEWFQPAQTSEPMLQEMESRASWVVIDGSGKHTHGFDALLALLETRPVFDVARAVLRLKPIPALGQFTYRRVASSRSILSQWPAFFQGRVPSVHLSRFGQGLAACFLLYALLWNVRNLNPLLYKDVLPPGANWIATLTRIDQRWGMFAPPPQTDGWYVVPAKQRNGREIDLFRNGQPVSWDKPASILNSYKNSRWRKFLEFLGKKEYSKYRGYYAGNLGQEWNSRHSAAEQVLTFRIYFLEKTNYLNGSESVPRKLLLWEQRCF